MKNKLNLSMLAFVTCISAHASDVPNEEADSSGNCTSSFARGFVEGAGICADVNDRYIDSADKCLTTMSKGVEIAVMISRLLSGTNS